MSDLPVDQVRTLLTVVEEGTLEAAAGVLHVTPSAVSQRIKALEQRIGRVLLVRTKPVELTDGGRVVVRFARQVAHLERDVREQLGATGEQVVRLPVAVNSDSLATWFLPALARVTSGARIGFELHRDDEGRTAGMLREGLVTAAVTSTPEPVPGCSVRALGLMRYLPVACPGFVERWLPELLPGHPPLRPVDRRRLLARMLPSTPVVTFDRHDRMQDRYVQSLTRADSPGPSSSSVRHRVPASQAFVDAVVAGLGWGMVPELQAGSLLHEGRLVELDPERPIDVPLFWQQWKLDSPALTAAAEVVLAEAAGALRPADQNVSRE
jgi:LysR family transcriptional regulator (chromosome initiation inhibitor)